MEPMGRAKGLRGVQFGVQALGFHVVEGSCGMRTWGGGFQDVP